LTLFVSGATRRSGRAITEVHNLCNIHLAGRFDLVVVDVRDNAALVASHRVTAVPTLVKNRPLPVRMVVGDMSDARRVMGGIDVPLVGGAN
jgi:circadian clock protein KaiB